jgi:hypothetical protein
LVNISREKSFEGRKVLERGTLLGVFCERVGRKERGRVDIIMEG